MKFEKVDYTKVYSSHRFFVIGYYPDMDVIAQFNLSSEKGARGLKDSNSVGMWKIKKLKNEKNQ